MKNQQQIDEEILVRDFIEGTKVWVEALHPLLIFKESPCLMCGVVPEKLEKLAIALEHLI